MDERSFETHPATLVLLGVVRRPPVVANCPLAAVHNQQQKWSGSEQQGMGVAGLASQETTNDAT